MGQLGLLEEAIEAYDELIRRYQDSGTSVIRKLTAIALLNTGVSLGNLGRLEVSIGVYEDIIHRYEGDTTPISENRSPKRNVIEAFL